MWQPTQEKDLRSSLRVHCLGIERVLGVLESVNRSEGPRMEEGLVVVCSVLLTHSPGSWPPHTVSQAVHCTIRGGVLLPTTV